MPRKKQPPLPISIMAPPAEPVVKKHSGGRPKVAPADVSLSPMHMARPVSEQFPELMPEVVPVKRATKRSIAKVHEGIYLKHSGPAAEEAWTQLRRRVRAGFPDAIKLSMQATGYVSSGGVQINNNIQNNQVEGGTDRSVDRLVRMLDSRDLKVSTAKDLVVDAELVPYDE